MQTQLAPSTFPNMKTQKQFALFVSIFSAAFIFCFVPAALSQKKPQALPLTPEWKKVIESNTDILGDEAMRRPEGPTYSYFANLAPPLLYVNTDFTYYPIVLGAPNAERKARLVSNGSTVNARSGSTARGSAMWHNAGIPVSFLLGTDGTTFGLERASLDGPHLADRCLPITQFSYAHQGTTYTEEAFVPIRDPYAKYAAVMLRFATTSGDGKVRAVLEKPRSGDGNLGLEVGQNVVCDPGGRGHVWFGGTWKWDNETSTLVAPVSSTNPAFLVVLTEGAYMTPETPDAKRYDELRKECAEAWSNILSRGTQIEVPEPIVNDAWRTCILGNAMLIEGDDLNYSAGNNYEKLYAGEGSDAVRSLLLYGQIDEGRRLVPPIMDYWRKNLTFHQAAHQLQLMAYYYWLTRDAQFIREQRPRWSREVNEILAGREKDTGLLPRERYAGDITTQVYSLSSNSGCWRGLRDMAAVLEDIGEKAEAKRIALTAVQFRKLILAAVEKSVYRDFDPPFVPVAFYGEEKPYERLTQTHWSAYYDLMIPYILGSEVFPSGSEFETDILRTLQERGGICEGMVRSAGQQPLFVGQASVNNLYTLRYTQTLFRRDEPYRALVSFYGKLGQAMSPDTFYSGEASGIAPFDAEGRGSYLPPNSAANAYFLWMLRYILIQDWDMNDDGKPDTLRLLFATPRDWLRDGAKINIERAPTAFGELSMNVESHLAKGEVLVHLKPLGPTRISPAVPQAPFAASPPRKPEKTLLRVRLPQGHTVIAAKAGKTTLNVDNNGTADISALKGDITVRFEVK